MLTTKYIRALGFEVRVTFQAQRVPSERLLRAEDTYQDGDLDADAPIVYARPGESILAAATRYLDDSEVAGMEPGDFRVEPQPGHDDTGDVLDEDAEPYFSYSTGKGYEAWSRWHVAREARAQEAEA